jgi:amino acid adenylation domain-containing protein
MNNPLDGISQLYPLSSVQREIWFDQCLFPDTPLSNVGCHCEIYGELDLHLFRQAITLLIKENDALRMVLTERDNTPFQSFPDMEDVNITLVDCSIERDPQQYALRHIWNVHNQPFRILEEPLFRNTLYKLSEHRYFWSHLYHHIAADGRAINLVAHRVAAHYNALLNGSPLPFRPEISYRNFLRHDALATDPERLEDHRQYWLKKFTPLPDPLFSAGSRYSGSTEAVSGGVLIGHLPRMQYERLGRLAERHSVSRVHVMIGILYVYFTRAQEQEECVIGLPVLNRNSPAFKKTIGLFVSIIPERFSYGNEISFIELIKAISGTLRQSYRHQRLPVSEINRLSGVLQKGRKRLFDLAFSLIKEDYSFSFGSIPVGETIWHIHDFEQIPLLIFMLDFSENEEVEFNLGYNQAYFDAPEIKYIQAQLLQLIEAVLANPEERISNLDILPPPEKEQLLINWNATDAPLPEKSLHQLFESHAAGRAEATALVFQTVRLCYADLNARANQLAHAMIALKTQSDAPVAIALDRSPEMIVAMIAVLKAGGCYLPLDPSYPAERLAFMLEDSGAELLITRQSLLKQLPFTAAHTLCIDSDHTYIASQAKHNPDLALSQQQLAYIIYTSGSTGVPKGVAIAHCGLSNMAMAQIAAFGLTSKSRVLQFASFSFDASVSEIAMALCSGAELHLPDEEQRFPGPSLLHYLDEAAITHLTLPPTALALLPRKPLPALEVLVVAGEPCLPALASFWSKGRRFFNAYGPTETTVCATIAECSHASIQTDVPLPVGRPIANTRLYVLDQNLQPTPTGTAGELHIGGIGLARGYLNRPEITAEKFISDPFSIHPGARLYKSGDLVRYRADGNLEFLGRLDHQVKIRGFRIEPGEIESALTAHPSIHSAVVIARKDASSQQHLIAYLVTGDLRPTITEIRNILHGTLPDYMLPSAFVFLESMPLTANGKVDRKSLPEPDCMPANNSAESPHDHIEELLVDLWAKALHQKSCSIHDNFFELGGESLSAARFTAILRDAADISIPVRWIFEAPTPVELAERIRLSRQNTETLLPIPVNSILPGTSRITPDLLPLIHLSQGEIDHILTTVEGGAGNLQDIYPLTPLQEGMYFHSKLQKNGDSYMSRHLFAVDCLARADIFTAALQFVIERHDMLRTSVVWGVLPEPVQVVWRHAPLRVEQLDFHGNNGLIADQLMSSFPLHNRLDLAHPPLLRIALAQDGERWLMLLVSHHLIMDYTTLIVMLDEITAHIDGTFERLPAPVPFRNFIARLHKKNTSGSSEPFFREMLGDIKKTTAPFGLLDVNGDGSTIVESHRELSIDFTLRLRAAARHFSATPAAICHLAWALLLSRCCGQKDIVFGTVLTGRMHGGAGVERAVGIFINTLPLRLTCDAQPVAETLRQTQHRLLALIRHEYASLSMAQRCSAVPASMPLFTSLLNYRHTARKNDAAFRIKGVELLRHSEGETNYPVGLSIDDFGEGLDLTVQIDASIDPDWICSIMQSALEVLVKALEEAPDTPLAELELFTPEEKQRVACQPIGSSEPQMTNATIHQRESGTL